MAYNLEEAQRAERNWAAYTTGINNGVAEVYLGEVDIQKSHVSFRLAKEFSEQMASNAEKAGNSRIARLIRTHFRETAGPTLVRFERVKDCVGQMAKSLEMRKSSKTGVAYEFHSSMAKSNVDEVGGMETPMSMFYNTLKFDLVRENLLDLGIAKKLGVAKMPPKTDEYIQLEQRLYEVVGECASKFDVRSANADGTPWTGWQKKQHDREEAEKASLVARNMPFDPMKAMEMFIEFGNKSLVLIANGKQPVANLPKIMVGYSAYSYIARVEHQVRHSISLERALTHDFGLGNDDSIAAMSICHNKTLEYLRKGFELEAAQEKAHDDLILMEDSD